MSYKMVIEENLNRLEYSFYPIIYKGDKYVVNFGIPYSYGIFGRVKIGEKMICCIYEYREKKNFFSKHKGKLLFEDEFTYLALDENKFDKILEFFLIVNKIGLKISLCLFLLGIIITVIISICYGFGLIQ